MEVVTATPNSGGVSPFHNRDVREWSHMDSLTGILERSRRETNHWTANTSNSSHKYGKVVDCRARSGVDGNLQQKARRQLEVFQSQIPGGRLQVIKTHTVSSSRWTNIPSRELSEHNTQTFEDLHLNVNPLDVTSQKSKASVGRSVGRRPPTRQQRARNEPATTSKNDDAPITSSHRVSRLCHQIHDSAVKQYFRRPSLSERLNGDCGADVNDVETTGGSEKNEHSTLTRTKSTSSEDIHSIESEQHSFFLNEKDKSTKSIEDLEDLEQLRSWRRTSKIRRSLQIPKQNKTPASKPPDLPENSGSVRRIREDLEKGRRLNTALRGNNVDLEALDQILQSISTPYADFEEPERDISGKEEEESPNKSKRNSFVTVESIKEVRNRLRRTGSPPGDIYRDKEEIDDGIVTEEFKMEKNSPSKVRSYVYGMESHLSKAPVNGTGSLESRAKHLNGNSTHRNEDWYNRRKSYGFEKMHGQHEDGISKIKNTESSTDSGICRSSEIVVPTGLESRADESNSDNENPFQNYISKDSNIEGTTITIPIISKDSPVSNTRKLFERELGDGTSYSIEAWRENEDVKRHSIAVDESKYVTKTSEPKLRRSSLAVNELYPENDDDNFLQGRKPKKVEFCKTEVHFTAESGRVNIVETDEKPPPTNNFRRRRRNSGLILDEFNSNGLPVFKFGDDIPNEESLNGENGHLQNIYSGLVTVNSNANLHHDFDEDAKENQDSEIPKGILKNKPIRPRPYILGDNENYLAKDLNSDNKNKPWDIKLKPVKSETPIWRSTVTVRNTYFEDEGNSDTDDYAKVEGEAPEFQKLLKNLKPVSKRPESFCDNFSGSFNGIRIVSPNIDSRRSSWSVADRVKHVEDLQYGESKGYLTKVNFGDGEATVIENNNKQINRHPTWPRIEETSTDVRKQILKKGLVVRIGRDGTNSKHTVCSKTTTNRNTSGTTTTTKITIDLTPSPTNEPSKGEANFPRAAPSHNFKSTSLILNTIKTENAMAAYAQTDRYDLDVRPRIPEQLEALRKLYEDVQSDSETDKEVQTLMSKSCKLDGGGLDEESSSVVSGSWSRVSAFKNLSNFNKVVTKSTKVAKSNLHAQLEKDLDSMQNVVDNKLKQPTKEQPEKLESQDQNGIRRNKINERTNHSPLVFRKAFTSRTANVTKTKFEVDKLSSPALVGQNTSKTDASCDSRLENRSANSSKMSDAKRGSLERQSRAKLSQHISPQRVGNKSSGKEVLRQPRKSEMAYFGVPASPRPVKKEIKENKLSEKPDLLQFARDKATSLEATTEPVYENINNLKKSTLNRGKREFDSSILEELTRAADQILQAVNGYTDEDSHNKFSTDDEDKRKNNHLREPLDTISETKSWKQGKTNNLRTTQNKNNNSKTKLKQTSSNSSVESVKKEVRQSTASNADQKVRRKITDSDSASTKANAKARRLQRASSREALLQSHGSSSEDLPAVVEVPLRKPRVARKNKPSQSTSATPEKTTTLSKKRDDTARSKIESRVPTAGLPEIRHKTAVSTIRSTAEKTATRDRSDLKKKPLYKRESRGTPAIPKNDKIRNSSNRETTNQRISTANVKKCSRYESSLTNSRHNK